MQMDALTNEELAVQIKNGKEEYLYKLWEQTQKFIKLRAKTYLKNENISFGGIGVEDLTQEGFFALLKAVKAYDETSGYTFLTYFGYYLKNAFRDAFGLRYKKTVSLDEPLPSEENHTLLDYLKDEDPYCNIDDYVNKSVYKKELRSALDLSLSILTPKARQMIELYYFCDLKSSSIAKLLNCSPTNVNAVIGNGLIQIYRSKYRDILRSFLPAKSVDVYNTGYFIWKTSGSIEEMFLIETEMKK